MKVEQDKERKYGSFWTCLACKENPDFEHKAMMTHIKDVHGIDPKNTKASRRMLMHIDGSDFYSSQYEWEINGLKFQQSTCNKRTGEDAAFWK